jgi:ferrous iron transport protein B
MNTTNSNASPATSGDDRQPAPGGAPRRIALIGNPNAGKTTLFNVLCGMRAKTANFPGSTVEARVGRWLHDHRTTEIIDLPGVYGLGLDRPESRVCTDYLKGNIDGIIASDVIVVVVDASHLARHLLIANQALQLGQPVVIAVSMMDLAERKGLTIDFDLLRDRLDCPVVGIAARRHEGLQELAAAIEEARVSQAPLPTRSNSDEVADWAAEIARAAVTRDLDAAPDSQLTDRIDAIVTHPVFGFFVFAAVMISLFFVIYTVAAWPMDMIDLIFAHVGGWVEAILPDGAIKSLVVDGIIAGVAGTVVFVPQIFLLFFLISLLEDTGYLARAAFVMDRPLRRFGLSGYSFIPLLSAHACAIPAIMSCRLIPDHRDRLATILIAPLMSCSARLPVYVLLIGLLFGDNALLAALAFTGCYVLGAVVGVLTAILVRRTLVRGAARPMVIELPEYTRPSLRTAWLMTYDRTILFLKKAGTVILAICIVLWWLSAYPASDPPAESVALRTEAQMVETVRPVDAEAMRAEADRLESRHAKANSFVGMIGRGVEPVFAPLGFDWQVTIGVLSSFLAREVFVSTMAVVVAGDESLAESEDDSLLQTLSTAKRDDGTPMLTGATSASLLVFYVLALQCLPTVAVTRRELNSWRWAIGQLAYMSVLAWIAAAITYRVALWLGLG